KISERPPNFRTEPPQVERGPSDIAFCPFAQSQRPDKACAKPRERLWEPLCLNCGTSLERIAPESLTQSLSEFVHGHIWWHGLCAPQNRVKRSKGGSPSMLQWINGEA